MVSWLKTQWLAVKKHKPFQYPQPTFTHHAVECIRQLFDLSDFKAVGNPLCRVAVLKIQGIISILKAVPAHDHIQRYQKALL